MHATFVTGNDGKAQEYAALLRIGVKALDLIEIQSLDVAEVAGVKAQDAYRKLQSPVLVDDTGLALDAWNGLPGALLAWWMKTVGPQGILDMAAGLSDRSVTATTALGYCDANGVQVFSGTLRGTLATEWRDDSRHPYGSFFIPNGYNQTLAELTDEQKNRISPRAIAIEKLKKALLGNAA